MHKGDELGYVLSGRLELKLDNAFHSAKEGDVIYLTSTMPSQWKNPGPGTARILWVKVK
jgi:quercetin dioxygenase-like cupin family protein